MDDTEHNERGKQPGVPWLGLRVALVRLLLLWEMLWRVAFAPLSAACFIAALSLFDVWRWTPDWLHLLVLLGLSGFSVWSLLNLGGGVRFPSRRAALARIELDNQLHHAPLQALEDSLARNAGAVGDATQDLWRLHLIRARRTAAGLRMRLARPNLLAHDPVGLRLMAGIAFAAGLFVAGDETMQRLHDGFWPFVQGASLHQTRIEAWISPPSYTNAAPVFLPGSSAESGVTASILGNALKSPNAPHRAPTGSVLSVRLFSIGGVGEIFITPAKGVSAPTAKPVQLTKTDSANQSGQLTLTHSSQIALRQSGRTLRQWPVNITPDLPPAIKFAEQPSVGPRGAMRLVFEFVDDYGITSANAELAPVMDVAEGAAAPQRPAAAPLVIALPVPAQNTKQGKQLAIVDLTEHVWAGSTVRLRLIVTDAAEQQGCSEPVEFRLPMRDFQNPLARALIEQRRTLLQEDSPLARVMRSLDALSHYPELFIADPVVYTGLRVARHRLELMRDKTAARSEVSGLLWKIALRLEDGNISLAADELHELQKKLADALRNGASEQEIAGLTQQLRDAIDRYLQAMTEQMLEDLDDNATSFPGTGERKQLDQKDITRMLDQIEQLGKTGSRAAAQDLLSKLQDILENLRLGMNQSQEGEQQAYREALDGLSGTLRQQQQLRDETYRQQLESESGEGENWAGMGGVQGKGSDGASKGSPSYNPDARQSLPGKQDALRNTLGELMRQLEAGQGKVPGALGKAEKSMGEAAQALREGEHGAALKDQNKTMEELRSGAEAVAKALRDAAKAGQANGENGDGEDDAEDPLGRRVPGLGAASGKSLAIPEQFDIERALEIRRELERRAGDRRRPMLELEYIDRLLKLF